MTDSSSLDGSQLQALLDILSHSATYSDIRDFRNPGTLEAYGPPFGAAQSHGSRTPALQALVARFVLNLPGLRNVDESFWTKRVSALISGFQAAALSESYDKGGVGIRRTLATAISALIEYLVRGVFAGFDEPEDDVGSRQYDTSKAEDLQRAFRDSMHQIVYGSLVDDMIATIERTDKLTDHTPQVQAAHEYILVNLASFMHYTLIISPKGQYLLTLIDNVNKLVPYAIIRSTLRIGNVASMISAMMKVGLAKMSLGSVSNWVGWTSGADEGMNLMQHIISQVLHWDIRDLKSKASKIEKDKNPPTKEQLDALKHYPQLPRHEHEHMREDSRTSSKSIVSVVLAARSVSTDLTPPQHRQAQDYLAMQLAIRDREQITKVLCHSQPDHLTQAVRDVVSAYEPVIREAHKAVDLSATVNDFELFFRDMLKLSKTAEHKGRGQAPPTVGDFVQLLKKHQSSSHRFLHQAAKNGRELTSWFRDYILEAASHFRRTAVQPPNPPSNAHEKNAGDLTASLVELFDSLPKEEQAGHLETLTQHADYLSNLHKASARRLDAVLKSAPTKHTAPKGTASLPINRPASPGSPNMAKGAEADAGPGAFLARWQALIDATELTPLAPTGPTQTAGHQHAAESSSHKPGSGESDDEDDVFEEAHEQVGQAGLDDAEKRRPPDTRALVEALQPAFKGVLAARGRT